MGRSGMSGSCGGGGAVAWIPSKLSDVIDMDIILS